MPIKFEILADSTIEFFQQLEDLLAGKPRVPLPHYGEQVVETAGAAGLTTPASEDDLAAAVAATIGITPEPEAKKPRVRKKANGAAKTTVKPLPGDDDDPLATAPAAEEEDELEQPLAGADLLAAAELKLRDLFRINSDAVRALRTKYLPLVTLEPGKQFTFKLVPTVHAQDLWDDAVALEQKLATP